MKTILLLSGYNEGHWGSRTVISRLRHYLSGEFRIINPTKDELQALHKARYDISEIMSFLTLYKDVDAIVVNGEGTMHGRNIKAPRIAAFPSLTSIPCFMVNATIHDVGDITLNRLDGWHGLFVRETGTERYLLDNGIDPKIVHLVGDAAFTQDFTILHDGEEETRYEDILIGDSTLPDVAEELQKIEGGTPWDIKDTSPLEVMPATFCLTGRFHGVCFALKTGTPFQFLSSNTPKIESMLADVISDSESMGPSSFRTDLHEIRQHVKNGMTAEDLADFWLDRCESMWHTLYTEKLIQYEEKVKNRTISMVEIIIQRVSNV